MNIFYALLQLQKVHLLHRPPEELQQWPGNFNRIIIKRSSRSAEQQGKKKKNWLSTWLHAINFGSDKIVCLYVRPFMLADVKCLVGRPFFSAEICKKIKWLQFWQKVIKYLLNKFTFQGGRSVLLKGESLHLFLPRPECNDLQCRLFLNNYVPIECWYGTQFEHVMGTLSKTGV